MDDELRAAFAADIGCPTDEVVLTTDEDPRVESVRHLVFVRHVSWARAKLVGHGPTPEVARASALGWAQGERIAWTKAVEQAEGGDAREDGR